MRKENADLIMGDQAVKKGEYNCICQREVGGWEVGSGPKQEQHLVQQKAAKIQNVFALYSSPKYLQQCHCG